MSNKKSSKMHLKKYQDKKGTFYKLSLIGRSALTLENYASSNFGNRFYSEEFLKGLCEQRNLIHVKVTKSVNLLILLTTALFFYDNISGTAPFFGLQISVPDGGALALSVLVSFTLLNTILAFIDQIIIDRYLSVLGERLGVYSFNLVVLNLTASNLWSESLSPKFFGLESGRSHKFSLAVFGTFILLLCGLLLLYPISAIGHIALPVLENGPFTIRSVLAIVALSVCGFSILVLVIFLLKYKFRPSGLSEPNEPVLPENFGDLGRPLHFENHTNAVVSSDDESDDPE